jgi:uncharacterized protein (TIGR02145 family)
MKKLLILILLISQYTFADSLLAYTNYQNPNDNEINQSSTNSQENLDSIYKNNLKSFTLSDGTKLSLKETVEWIKTKKLNGKDKLDGLIFIYEYPNVGNEVKNAIAENFAEGMTRPLTPFKSEKAALNYIKDKFGDNIDLVNRIWNKIKADKTFYDKGFSFDRILNFFDFTNYPPIVIKVFLISLLVIFSNIIYKKMLIKDKVKEKQRKELNSKILSENTNNSKKTNAIEQNENSDLTSCHEVKILNQVWSFKNLDVDRFNNGDEIYEAKTEEDWINAFKNNQPAWCYYENKQENNFYYGKLYNYYAVNDIRGIAPLGYRIPKIVDWELLVNNLGGKKQAGEFLKSEAFWTLNKVSKPSFSNYGQNKLMLHNVTSVFEAMPGGIRKEYGNFTSIGKDGNWWAISENTANIKKYISLGYYNNSVFFNDANIGYGLSVRCIKI